MFNFSNLSDYEFELLCKDESEDASDVIFKG